MSSLTKDSAISKNTDDDVDILADAMMDEDVIAKYLASHPDFFNRHADLLESIQVPHQAGAASLIERQVAVLREKSRDLEEQLNGLIRTARGNEQIVTRLQRFTLELMRADDLDGVIATCQDVLRDDFNADFVSVRIISNDANNTGLHFINSDDKGLVPFKRLFDSKKPVCGRLKENQQTFLFNDNAGKVNSVALIPLSGLGAELELGVEKLGILALGSKDEARFHPGMGTVFISHLGELVSSGLLRYLKK